MLRQTFFLSTYDRIQNDGGLLLKLAVVDFWKLVDKVITRVPVSCYQEAYKSGVGCDSLNELPDPWYSRGRRCHTIDLGVAEFGKQCSQIHPRSW